MSLERLPSKERTSLASQRKESTAESSHGKRTSIEAAQEKRLWTEVEDAKKLSTELPHEKRLSTDSSHPMRLTAEEAHAKRFSSDGTYPTRLSSEALAEKHASTEGEDTSLEHASMEVLVGDGDTSKDDSDSSSCLCEEEETSDDAVTEEQDSDDDSDALQKVPAEMEVTPAAAEVTSEMNLLEQSELSLLGVASEEFLLEYLDQLPVEKPDPTKRHHLAVQHRRQDEPPPQSPRLALLELDTSPLFLEPPLEQDPRLANWDRWLADHRRQHRHLARDSPSLAMNTEDVRYLIERKKVLDYTRIDAPPDPFRGGPEFWRMPYTLPDHGDVTDDVPIYTAQMTLPEKGIIPTIEYVGVPDHIRKEKEVYGKLDRRSPRDIWDTNAYMQQQRVVLKEKLAFVEAHEPDMSELVIVGNQWQKRDGRLAQDAPVLTVSQEPADMREREWEDELTASLISMLRDESEGRPQVFRDLDGIACLRIQDREFYYVEPPRSRKVAMQLARERLLRLERDENPVEFRLTFASPPGKTRTETLRLENRGTVKVCYAWRRCVARKPDFPVAVTLRADAAGGQHFFFNKNDDLLLPGQVLEFRVTYRSHRPGVFQESWRLVTEPRFVDDDEDVFTVHLWGVTTPPDDVRDQMARLRHHVERRVQTASARDALYTALEHAKYPTYHDPPYGQNFLTEEKFLHVNPDYNYDGELVRNLCDIHDVIATTAPLGDWDFKIPSLRQIVIDHTEGEARQNHLDTLSEIAIKLRKRAYITRDGRLRKYTCVYNLLCNFASTIDREGQNLKVTYGLAKRTEMPLEVRYEKGKRTVSTEAVKRPKSKPKLKRGGKSASSTRELTKTSRTLVKESSSSSSLSDENLAMTSAAASETALPTISPSRMLSLTSLFTPAAGFSESTTRLLSTLTTSLPVEPVPSVPMLPIVLPAVDELPSTEVDEKLVRRVYRQSLYVMIREALCHTVEHISAALDSYKQI